MKFTISVFMFAIGFMLMLTKIDILFYIGLVMLLIGTVMYIRDRNKIKHEIRRYQREMFDDDKYLID